MATSTTTSPAISPSKMPIYPTMDSLQAVVELAYSQFPGIPQNTVLGVLFIYHNTLLAQLDKEKP